MDVKLFVRPTCPLSPAARDACAEIEGLQVFDLAELAGLAEAFTHHVEVTPSVIVVDSSGREVAAWRGHAPAASELRRMLLH